MIGAGNQALSCHSSGLRAEDLSHDLGDAADTAQSSCGSHGRLAEASMQCRMARGLMLSKTSLDGMSRP